MDKRNIIKIINHREIIIFSGTHKQAMEFLRKSPEYKEPIRKRPCEFEVLLYREFDPSEKNESLGENYTVEGYGLFIKWGSDVEMDGIKGALNITVGLVEAEDGQVYNVHPSNIKFLDR